MDADITQQLDIIEVKQPIAIFQHQRLTVRKIDEFFHLPFEAHGIVVDLLNREHFAHVRFTGRITDHCSTGAKQRNWAMPCMLKALHNNHLKEMADVQAIGGRIKPDIERNLLAIEKFFDLLRVCHLRNQAASG